MLLLLEYVTLGAGRPTVAQMEILKRSVQLNLNLTHDYSGKLISPD